MDEEQIDVALLYPAIGIFWEGWVQDAKLASAYIRAYNCWIIDFCSDHKKRLFPAMFPSSAPEGAVLEAGANWLSAWLDRLDHKYRPNIDADFRVVKDLKERIASLPEETQRKVLGENAVRFYGLDV